MNYFRKIILTSFLLLIMNQATLLAHPGHGDSAGHSLFHYLTEPMHAMVFGAVVLMMAISSTWLIQRMKKRAKERA